MPLLGKNPYEKISFALIDKSFSFSPKKPFQILAERRLCRREIKLDFLQNSNWRRGWDSSSPVTGGAYGTTPITPSGPGFSKKQSSLLFLDTLRIPHFQHATNKYEPWFVFIWPWRRGWDSNPRDPERSRLSKPLH